MRLLTVLGTRPQMVKAGPVSRALAAAGVEEVVLLTGQHYSAELTGPAADLPPPARTLGVGSGSHASQVAAAARGTADFAREARPDAVLVVGDTNSALAAALGARAAGVPLVHGEAGVRLGSLSLPEEVNRIAVDHLSDLCLCPTERAAASLRAEGARGGVVAAGDPLLDALVDRGVGIRAGEPRDPGVLLCTFHRAENTDDPARLRRILGALGALGARGARVLLPLHPRTAAALRRAGEALPPGVRGVPPLEHGALLDGIRGATAVITDSGGVQREAFWMGVPCIVLRAACEWRETVDAGWAVCVDADPERIAAAAAAPPRGAALPDRAAFGGGRAAARWVAAVAERFG